MKIGGNLVDVLKRKVFPADIEISNKKIKKITPVLKSFDTFIMPGFVDAHIHIESSFLVPSKFAEAVLPHGTVAVVANPEGIANVLGIKGIDFMIEDSKNSPLKTFFTVPISVPATKFETSGAVLDIKATIKLLRKKAVVALGDTADFQAIINDNPELLAKIAAAKQLKKPVDGNCPMLSGEPLKEYISLGISTDLGCTTYDEAKEKADLGLKIMIKEGSFSSNIEDLISLAKNEKYTCFLVSDHKQPSDLIEGHINLMLRKIVSLGVDPIQAIRLATLNPVQHYKLNVGLLRKGDDADFVIVNNLTSFDVLETWVKGEKVAEKGKSLFKAGDINPINFFVFNDKFNSDFRLKSFKPFQRVKVIGLLENQLVTNELATELNVNNNVIENDPSIDVLKAAVVERYGNNNLAVAFVKGFSLFDGTLASSVSCGSNNIVAVGTNDNDIASSVNHLKKIGGGLIVVYEGNIIAGLSLPVAGLMSDKSIEEVVGLLENLNNEARILGCKLNNPFLTLSYLTALSISKLRLSDKGLFDVDSSNFTNLFVD